MMTSSGKTRALSAADWANVLMGLWIVVSPFVLHFSWNTAAMWNNIAVGAAITLLAVANAVLGEVMAGGLVLLATWLFFSPFVLHFAYIAFPGNNVLMAFAVIAGAAASEGLRPGTVHQR